MIDEGEFAGLSSVKKCPKCGGALEEGLLDAPRGIDWHTHTHTGTLLSLMALEDAEASNVEVQEMRTRPLPLWKGQGVKP